MWMDVRNWRLGEFMKSGGEEWNSESAKESEIKKVLVE